MKILGLPGINPATQNWMNNLFNIIELGQSSSVIQNYQCWKTPGTKLDIDTEIERARAIDADLLIAKSIGTVIALNGYNKKILTAKQCVFIGIPINNFGSKAIKILQEHVSGETTILFIQQSNDKLGSFTTLTNYLPDNKLITTSEISGSDHMYIDINQLKNIIESWHEKI